MLSKLSANEKRILSELITDANASNVEIAKRVSLTPAAVGKIRKKLMDKGIIEGYSVDVNLEKAGLVAFAIVFIKFKDQSWNFKKGLNITDLLIDTPNIIGIFRIQESDTSHILMFAFRNLMEMDRYFHVLQSQFSNYIEIKKMYSFSNDSILKDSPQQLIVKMINEMDKERMPEPSFLLAKQVHLKDADNGDTVDQW